MIEDKSMSRVIVQSYSYGCDVVPACMVSIIEPYQPVISFMEILDDFPLNEIP